MIAKVFVFLAVVAAARAVGLGAPLLGAGHLGAAPLAYAGHLGYGAGLAAGPWGYGVGALGLGHGLAAGNLRANGIVGAGVLGSRYGGVIAHNAVGWGHGGLLGLGHGAGLAKAIW